MKNNQSRGILFIEMELDSSVQGEKDTFTKRPALFRYAF